MTYERAIEMANKIETTEDWPGDIEVIECIVALRDKIRELEARSGSTSLSPQEPA